MSPLTILLAADPQASALFQAIGAALTEAQQLHVSANWPQLAAWLKTEEGRIALQTFVQDWQTTMRPAT